MNFVDTLRGLWRRWYIVLPGVLIAAALAFGTWSAIPPGYERSSTQLLIPGEASMPEGANPYLFLGGLAPAADVLVRAVGAENVVNDVTAQQSGVQIEITRDTSTAGPVIVIVVTAATDAAAEEVLGLLVDRTESVLTELQETENIAVQNRVSVLPITIDSQSILQQRTRYIASGAVGLAGLALTLIIAGLVDGYSQQRKRRVERTDERADTEDAENTEDTAQADDQVDPTRASRVSPAVKRSSRAPQPAPLTTEFDQTDDDETEAAMPSPVHSTR